MANGNGEQQRTQSHEVVGAQFDRGTFTSGLAGGIIGTTAAITLIDQPESTIVSTMSVDGDGAMHEVTPDATVSGLDGFIAGALVGATAYTAIKAWMNQRVSRETA